MFSTIYPCLRRQLLRCNIHKQFKRYRQTKFGFDLPIETVDPTNCVIQPHGRNQKEILRPTKYSEVQLWMLNSYMESLIATPLPHRRLIGISGDGASSLINGLITNDLNNLDKNKIIFTYALNSKGRILYEMLIYRFAQVAKLLDSSTLERFSGTEENFIIECEDTVADDLIKHIRSFLIRRKINFIPLSDTLNLFHVYPTPFEQENPRVYQVFNDPRHSDLGSRIVIPKNYDFKHYTPDLIHASPLCYRDYINHHAIPEGPLDITPSKFFPLEFSGDLMNGISFTKGCYLGQELTTRTYYTGKINKRLMALRWSIYSEPLVIEPGYEIVDCMDINFKKVGKVINFHNLLSSGIALADYRQLRLYPRIPAVRIPPKKFEQIILHPPFWWSHEQVLVFEKEEDIAWERTEKNVSRSVDHVDHTDLNLMDLQTFLVDYGFDVHSKI